MLVEELFDGGELVATIATGTARTTALLALEKQLFEHLEVVHYVEHRAATRRLVEQPLAVQYVVGEEFRFGIVLSRRVGHVVVFGKLVEGAHALFAIATATAFLDARLKVGADERVEFGAQTGVELDLRVVLGARGQPFQEIELFCYGKG